uniref:Putative secreted protein n=1 Tax=Xenopsylla cheopis TaxID=163159 RepID=A0A6M2DVZ4_XENCH
MWNQLGALVNLWVSLESQIVRLIQTQMKEMKAKQSPVILMNQSQDCQNMKLHTVSFPYLLVLFPKSKSLILHQV